MANGDSVIERGDKEEVPDAPAARAEDWGGYSNSALAKSGPGGRALSQPQLNFPAMKE